MSNTTETVSQVLGPLQLQWVEALESGKFEQGKNVLRSEDDKFCCLGVACELSGIKPVLNTSYYGINRLVYEYLGERHYLPKEIINKLKFLDNQGVAFRGSVRDAISWLNDDGKSFKEIAAIVRANPAKYFAEPA